MEVFFASVLSSERRLGTEDLVMPEASTAPLGFALWSASHESVPARAEQQRLHGVGGAVGRIDGGAASGVGGGGDGVPWHGERDVGAAARGQRDRGKHRVRGRGGISRRRGGWGGVSGVPPARHGMRGEPRSHEGQTDEQNFVGRKKMSTFHSF